VSHQDKGQACVEALLSTCVGCS